MENENSMNLIKTYYREHLFTVCKLNAKHNRSSYVVNYISVWLEPCYTHKLELIQLR